MAESDEVLEVRRRARRRLIGATALVMLLVIVPPWLMDLEPRPVTSNLTVEIPGKDQPKLDVSGAPAAKSPGPSASKAETAATEAPPAGISGAVPDRGREDADARAKATAAASIDAAKPAAKAQPPDAVKLPAVRDVRPKSGAESHAGDKAPQVAATKPGKDDAERAAAILNNESYFVPLGAYKSADNAKQVQQKAGALGLRAFVEVVDVNGVPQSRVRAGPFASRDAAEAARERLRSAGLDPGPVRTR